MVSVLSELVPSLGGSEWERNVLRLHPTASPSLPSAFSNTSQAPTKFCTWVHVCLRAQVLATEILSHPLSSFVLEQHPLQYAAHTKTSVSVRTERLLRSSSPLLLG
eukprot:XP_001692359.1 predicted protein [Chlamydomonas reinhardtii]